jgi:hypothetical protein
LSASGENFPLPASLAAARLPSMRLRSWTDALLPEHLSLPAAGAPGRIVSFDSEKKPVAV